MKKTEKKAALRRLTVMAVMSAVAFILMVLEFPIPLTPSFLKFDFSDLPAFITAFALGPLEGMAVELVKNLLHLSLSTTSGVGELANFLIGSALVFPAGLVYRNRKTRRGALIGAICGAIFASAVSFPVNYYITYPFYSGFLPMDAIISMYTAIVPIADTLPKALIIVNVPFTLVKGFTCALLTFLIYKKISPIIKGKDNV